LTSKKSKTAKGSNYSSRTPHGIRQETRRQRMISTEVFGILSTTILNHLSDPRIKGISITHVELSGDLHHARVFISSSSQGSDIKNALDALRQANGFLRKKLATKMTTRRVPDLQFFIDDVIYDAWDLNKLIDGIEIVDYPEDEEQETIETDDENNEN
jgi:ribosome-binding factor A